MTKQQHGVGYYTCPHCQEAVRFLVGIFNGTDEYGPTIEIREPVSTVAEDHDRNCAYLAAALNRQVEFIVDGL